MAEPATAPVQLIEKGPYSRDGVFYLTDKLPEGYSFGSFRRRASMMVSDGPWLKQNLWNEADMRVQLGLENVFSDIYGELSGFRQQGIAELVVNGQHVFAPDAERRSIEADFSLYDNAVEAVVQMYGTRLNPIDQQKMIEKAFSDSNTRPEQRLGRRDRGRGLKLAVTYLHRIAYNLEIAPAQDGLYVAKVRATVALGAEDEGSLANVGIIQPQQKSA